MAKIDKYYRTVPKIYKPENNPVMKAILEALAGGDAEIEQQIQNTKAQLFVRTAEGQNLDKLANSLGVSRPTSLGLTDAEYQELIPNLSLKAKQVRKAFYDTADVFWGPLFSRTNVQTINSETYDINPGEELLISVDDGETQSIKVLANEVATPGAATAEEVAAILSRIDGATISIVEDSITGDKFVNIRTNTPGPRGALEIFQSTILGASKLNFEVRKYELREQDQRVMLYEINPNEVVVEIPAVVPALRRTLKGSHHCHADSTLQPPVAPANEIWQGSFFFDPSGSTATYTVTQQSAALDQAINPGDVLTSITVDDTSGLESTSGVLIFGWGTDNEEQPVRFRGVPNSKTILIDPSYIFSKAHAVGEKVNVILDQRPYIPRRDGTDLSIYLTSPSDAREVVQEILRTLAAAGIILNFVILAPSYRYLCDNPYLVDDNAPESN